MATQTARPNVIVFFTDQQRWDTTGIHGNPLGLTPNFDRMARSGTDVHYSFTCQPVCGPARSCLQTGRYATNTGVFRNGIVLDAGMETLGTSFRDAGYATGYIGKWHLGDADPTPVTQRAGYSLLACGQSAGIHLRRLRYAGLQHRRPACKAARLSRRCPDRCCHSLCRQPSGRTILPVYLVYRAASPESSR